MAATVRAIHASPAAVGAARRPPGERPPAGERVHDDDAGSAAVPAATIASSVWRSAGEPPGETAKVVSSAIRAPGAAARIRPTAAPTRRRSSPAGTPTSSCPACTITSAGPSPRSSSWLSMRDIGPRPLALVLT